MARAVARRTGKPAYVGCSMVMAGASVEEEAAGLRAVITAVMGLLEGKWEQKADFEQGIQ